MITPELWGRSSRPMEEMVTSLCRYSAGMPVAWNRSPKFWNAMFSPEEAGAADGGAYVAYKHDGKGVDAEMHEAANYVLKAGDSADNTAEAGGAADSDQGHDRHGDGAGEERLDIHGLLLDNGEENIADYYAAAEGHFGGQLYNVEA